MIKYIILSVLVVLASNLNASNFDDPSSGGTWKSPGLNPEPACERVCSSQIHQCLITCNRTEGIETMHRCISSCNMSYCWKECK